MSHKDENKDDRADRADSTGATAATGIMSSAGSSNLDVNNSFNPYKSGMSPVTMSQTGSSSFAFNQALRNQTGNIQRSWVDPWEMTPSAKFYQKNYESPTRQMVANSIVGNNNLNQSYNSSSSLQNVQIINNIQNININNQSGNYKNINININNNNNNPDLISPLLDNNTIPENDELDIDLDEDDDDNNNIITDSKKFGPWDGVMTGALLNIWGVIMFLRLGWIIGQAGVIGTILIIIAATTVTTLTTISMSAICTNGKIEAGGAYYIISRTIGPQFGGSVGILLTLGSMVAVSLYLIGFAESFTDNLDSQFDFRFEFGDDCSHSLSSSCKINNIRIWTNVFLIIVLIMAIVSLNLVIKAQIGLLMWIFFSIITLIIGSFYQTEPDVLFGVMEGFNNGNFTKNLDANFTDGYNFWTVLAIFFPAVTGIMAGANISGDLRNPSKDIPTGTFTAIIISSTVYIILTILIGATAKRSALVDDALIMTKICVWDYIIYFGVYAATLSSAIASLVGAPRILMAVGNDKILNIPGIKFFTKVDKDNNPIRGYFLTFFIAAGVNLVAAIDAVAPLISQFFMMVYLLINFSCFIMTISRSPGWRPSFRWFNGYTAASGTLLCLIFMFLLDYLYALATILIAFMTWLYIFILDPEVTWGGAFHSRAIYQTYRALLNLALIDDSTPNEVNWRPSFQVVTFSKKYSLTKFVETLRKGHSLIFSCEIYHANYRKSMIGKLEQEHQQQIDKQFDNNIKLDDNNKKTDDLSYISLKKGYLPIRKYTHKTMGIKGKRSLGFNDVIITDGSYRNCMQTILQNSGLGLLTPNTVIMNLLREIDDKDDDDIDIEFKDIDDNIDSNSYIKSDEYVEIIRDTLLYGYGVMICNGLCDIEKFHKIDWSLNNCFENIIDVWWIVDDGGLTLLIPYIMCLCKFWGKCKVRINLIKDENLYNDQNEEAQFNKIQELIKKLRLGKTYYDKPRIIGVKKNDPSQDTINKFEKLSKTKVTNSKRQSVLLRWLRLSELLQEYSKQTAMVVVTLPVPTSYINPKQYCAILHLLSDQNLLPPTILMRGNGEQALTFYSE